MATSHFTTTEKFRKKLGKLASDNQMQFSEVDDTVLACRLEDAYNIIEGYLLQRGLSLVSISTWARGEEYQLDIATYWYAKDSGWGGKSIEEHDWTKVFNREKELAVVAIVNNDGELLASSMNKGFAKGFNLVDKNESLGYYY